MARVINMKSVYCIAKIISKSIVAGEAHMLFVCTIQLKRFVPGTKPLFIMRISAFKYSILLLQNMQYKRPCEKGMQLFTDKNDR